MVKGLYTAYTGMVQEQKRMDVLANNLANATTTGYKKEGYTNESFSQKLAIRIKDTSTAAPATGIGHLTLGVKVGENYTDWGQGSLQLTEKDSDIAIAGDGFFAIEFTNKDGEKSIKYTKDGAFSVDRDGYFRTSDGDYLLNKQGALNSTQGAYVQIDPSIDYQIDSRGFIYQNNQVVGQLGVVNIDNYDYIAKYGENLYDLIPGGNIIDSDAEIIQGALEASNINVVDEMVDLIAISRAYETGQKMIQTIDNTLDKAVNNVGRTS